MSKKGAMRTVTICFWTYMIVMLILSFLIEFSKSEWSESLTQKTQPEIISSYLMGIAMTIFMYLVQNLFVIFIYLGIKLGIRKFKKEKLSEIDFKKYKDYYREILKGYSPSELSYIDDFEINYPKDIVATLLSLKLKKRIELTENIEKTNTIENELSSNENYILEHIYDGKLKEVDQLVYKIKIEEDAIKSDLIKPSKIEWKKIAKSLIGFILIMTILIMTISFLFQNTFFGPNPENIEIFKVLILMFLMFFTFLFPLFTSIYLIAYLIKIGVNSFIRTKKGKEINEKLEGLKNYIQEYSMIKDKNSENIEIWEDYLIYSIIFNQNSKVIQEISDKYIQMMI